MYPVWGPPLSIINLELMTTTNEKGSASPDITACPSKSHRHQVCMFAVFSTGQKFLMPTVLVEDFNRQGLMKRPASALMKRPASLMKRPAAVIIMIIPGDLRCCSLFLFMAWLEAKQQTCWTDHRCERTSLASPMMSGLVRKTLQLIPSI